MTRDKLLAYVGSLEPDFNALFFLLENLEKQSCHDTLSEEYQIVAACLEVFDKRTEMRLA